MIVKKKQKNRHTEQEKEKTISARTEAYLLSNLHNYYYYYYYYYYYDVHSKFPFDKKDCKFNDELPTGE